MPVPPHLAHVSERIGVISNGRARMVCSAFCVAPSIIATAAHCIVPPKADRPVLSADFVFSRAYGRSHDQSRLAGFATRSTAQNILTGDFQMQTRPPIDAVEDWALARLARPICAGRHLLLHPLPPAEIFRLSAERRVYQIAYHRDRPGWHAAYSGPCHFGRDFPESEWSRTAAEFKRPQDVLLHTCDTGEASSGSPIIAETAMGPVVVALNVGTYVQPRVGTAPGQVREVIIANTAILIAPLVRALPLLQRAELLRTGSELRGLQAHLAALGHYHGRLDGDYGPLLRTAIRAFERSRGSEPTGLATRALLAELELEAAERHRATAGSWDRRTMMPPPAEMPASERLRLFAPPLQPAFPPR